MKAIKLVFITAMLFCLVGSVSAQAGNSINKLTASYLSLKNALVAGDSKAAQTSAKAMLVNLSAQPDKSLKPDQQKLLAAYLDKLKFDSRHISEVTLIDHQREHFASLSKNMYTVLNGLNVNSSTLYEQYCPMKKSYWLSESAKIENPYYGKAMLECGEVKATLKPAK